MEINKKFNKLIGQMSDNQFWAYVREWFDEQYILNVMNNWEDETKKEEIKNIKKIMEKIK